MYEIPCQEFYKLENYFEALAKSCLPYLSVKPSPPKSPLNPWIWPSKPWSRIHIDFAGPFNAKSHFIIVDAHSKWPDVFEMTSTTTSKTIDVLQNVFAIHGLPDHFVSHSGLQFTSMEFQHFLSCNDINHTRTALYHPAPTVLQSDLFRPLRRPLWRGRVMQDRHSTN